MRRNWLLQFTEA